MPGWEHCGLRERGNVLNFSLWSQVCPAWGEGGVAMGACFVFLE